MEERNQYPIEINKNGDEYRVSLPVEKEALHDFIGKLLGRPQTFSGRLKGDFSIDKEGLINIYHLVNQRIMSQNNTALVSFTITVFYTDDTSITLNSFEDFSTFTEIKPLVIGGLSLSWIYLVQFNNVKSPEKQTIDIYFDARLPDLDNISIEGFSDPVKIIETKIGNKRRSLGMYYKISHTNRTWGHDLQNLLSGHLQNYLVHLRGLKKFATEKKFWIAMSITTIFVLSSFGFVAKIMSDYSDSLKSAADEISKRYGAGFSQVSDRLDFVIKLLINQIDGIPTSLAPIGLFITIFIAAIMFTVVYTSSYFETRSFIVLNDATKQERVRFESSYKNSKLRLIVAFVASIALAVFGNGAYYWVAKWIGWQ